MIPEITEQFNASKFIDETAPSYRIFIALIGSAVSCPINFPRWLAKSNQGFIIFASSAVIEGILRALDTAPVKR